MNNSLYVLGWKYLPASIKSNFVTTASVLRPSGSTSRANLMLSEVAMSALAAETASMIEFGFTIYLAMSDLIWPSISSG